MSSPKLRSSSRHSPAYLEASPGGRSMSSYQSVGMTPRSGSYMSPSTPSSPPSTAAKVSSFFTPTVLLAIVIVVLLAIVGAVIYLYVLWRRQEVSIADVRHKQALCLRESDLSGAFRDVTKHVRDDIVSEAKSSQDQTLAVVKEALEKRAARWKRREDELQRKIAELTRIVTELAAKPTATSTQPAEMRANDKGANLTKRHPPQPVAQPSQRDSQRNNPFEPVVVTSTIQPLPTPVSIQTSNPNTVATPPVPPAQTQPSQSEVCSDKLERGESLRSKLEVATTANVVEIPLSPEVPAPTDESVHSPAVFVAKEAPAAEALPIETSVSAAKIEFVQTDFALTQLEQQPNAAVDTSLANVAADGGVCETNVVVVNMNANESATEAMAQPSAFGGSGAGAKSLTPRNYSEQRDGFGNKRTASSGGGFGLDRGDRNKRGPLTPRSFF